MKTLLLLTLVLILAASSVQAQVELATQAIVRTKGDSAVVTTVANRYVLNHKVTPRVAIFNAEATSSDKTLYIFVGALKDTTDATNWQPLPPQSYVNFIPFGRDTVLTKAKSGTVKRYIYTW
jgi:hypothetical protein